MLIEILLISATSVFLSLSFLFGFLQKDKPARLFEIISLSLLLAWTVTRSVQARHAPFSGAYESMVFFGFLLLLKVFFSGKIPSQTRNWLKLPTLLFLAATFLLPTSLKEVNSLVPTLRSFWMYIHVPSFFIGYASLTTAFVLTLIGFFSKKDLFAMLQSEMKLSFFFLSAGIITGAFWGEAAWGNFWSWDAKEIWALVTWLLALLYFHSKSKKMHSVVVILAFFAMLFTYFGVMFLLPGLHSYV